MGKLEKWVDYKHFIFSLYKKKELGAWGISMVIKLHSDFEHWVSA